MSHLGNLCAINGVRGAALFLPDGQCVESTLPAPYEPDYSLTILKQLLVAFESLAFVDSSPLRVLCARFSEGLVTVGVHARYRLLALSEPTTNLMMVNVALGALSNRIARDGGLHASLASNPPSMNSAASINSQMMDPFSPSERRRLAATVAKTGQQSAPSVSVSDFTLNSAQLRAVPPANAVPIEVMRVVLKAASRAVGPMAKPILRREIARLGYTTTTLPVDQLPSVCARIAAKIERADMKARFEAATRDLMR